MFRCFKCDRNAMAIDFFVAVLICLTSATIAISAAIVFHGYHHQDCSRRR